MKYIVYKGTGGLTHFLRGLSTAIKHAKNYDRHLIIDTAQHKAFKMSFSEFFKIKDEEVSYACSYQDIPKDLKYHNLSINQLKKNKVKYNSINVGYKLANYHVSKFPLESSEDQIIVYAGWWGDYQNINKYIKVRKKILEKLANYQIDQKYIGVHFRNTDRKNDLEVFVKKITEKVKKSGIQTIYLATDDFTAAEKFKTALPNLKFISFVNPYHNNDKKVKNTHYGNPNKYQQIFDTLLDIYILLSADRFINSENSGLSQWLISMRKTGENIFQ